MIFLDALLHLIYFVALVIVVIVGCLSIGRTVEVRIERFRARRELAKARVLRRSEEPAVERGRDWQFPRWSNRTAEYVAPAGKTSVGIREKS
jgi:hypothetical protein